MKLLKVGADGHKEEQLRRRVVWPLERGLRPALVFVLLQAVYSPDSVTGRVPFPGWLCFKWDEDVPCELALLHCGVLIQLQRHKGEPNSCCLHTSVRGAKLVEPNSVKQMEGSATFCHEVYFQRGIFRATR